MVRVNKAVDPETLMKNYHLVQILPNCLIIDQT